MSGKQIIIFLTIVVLLSSGITLGSEVKADISGNTADLSVTSSFSGVNDVGGVMSVDAPQTVTITYTVTNNSGKTVCKVTPKLEISHATDNTTCTLDSFPMVFKLVTLEDGDSCQFTCKYKLSLKSGATSGGSVNFSFSATALEKKLWKPSTFHSNTISDTVTVNVPPPPVPPVSLVAKSSFGGVDTEGGIMSVDSPKTITIEYTVTNNSGKSLRPVTPDMSITPSENVNCSTILSPIKYLFSVDDGENCKFYCTYVLSLKDGATSGGTVDFSFTAKGEYSGFETSSNIVTDQVTVNVPVPPVSLVAESSFGGVDTEGGIMSVDSPKTVTIEYTVTNNSGKILCPVTPDLQISASGGARYSVILDPLTCVIPIMDGGQCKFFCSYLLYLEDGATSDGTVEFTFKAKANYLTYETESTEISDSVGVKVFDPEPLDVDSSYLRVENGAVDAPQLITATYTVKNNSGTTACNIEPKLSINENGEAKCTKLTGPISPLLLLTDGNQHSFVYTFILSVPNGSTSGGSVEFTFTTQAEDLVGKSLESDSLTDDITVNILSPTCLTVESSLDSVSPLSINAPEDLSITYTVTNNCGKTVYDVCGIMAEPQTTGNATCTEVPIGSGISDIIILKDGESCQFTYDYSLGLTEGATTGGTVDFSFQATATTYLLDFIDLTKQTLVSECSDAEVGVDTPVNLSATIELLDYYGDYMYHLTDPITVRLTVTNNGDSTALPATYMPSASGSIQQGISTCVFDPCITPSCPHLVGACGCPVLVSGDATAIHAGESNVYEWTFPAKAFGTLCFECALETVDEKDILPAGGMDLLASEYMPPVKTCVDVFSHEATIGFTSIASSTVTEVNRLTGVVSCSWARWDEFITDNPDFIPTADQLETLDTIGEYSEKVISLGNSYLAKTYLSKMMPLIESLLAGI